MFVAAACTAPTSVQNQGSPTPSRSPATTAPVVLTPAPAVSFSGTAFCRGSYVSPCSAKLPFSGGAPGGTPSATVVGLAQYCPSTGCYPTPRALPPSFTMTVSGGFVTVAVQADCGGDATGGCPSGWGGVIKVSLTDQSTCSAGSTCASSGIGDFTIAIAGG
jgi:hypothetical protein